MTEETNAPVVSCPNCGAKTRWSRKNPHRPFCSERCKNRDFIAWANEEHVIEGSPTYDDLLSDDLDREQ